PWLLYYIWPWRRNRHGVETRWSAGAYRKAQTGGTCYNNHIDGPLLRLAEVSITRPVNFQVRLKARLVIFVMAAGACSWSAGFAQIGPRPGTRRRNFPLGGLDMPNPDLPDVNYKGKIEKLDDKMILLRLDDGRTGNFERTRKTKFFKDSKEVKGADFHTG